MPALKRLEVASNQLQSLPEKLANLPSLNSVNLRHNPWQSLPQNLLDSVSVELDIADKMRLFDFSYHGADNSGISEWDERIFRPDADKDADVIAEFERIVVENDISELKTPLAALLKKSIVFHQSGPDDYSQIGNHRFGGMPDLPATIPYPRFWRKHKRGQGFIHL
jgi:Leucine-rich repeat (LRR) protein